MDKGFLFNVKALILHPKKIVLDYIHGKRKGIMNPISFLIITLSIYLIAESMFWLPTDDTDTTEKTVLGQKAYDMGAVMAEFIYEYFTYFFIFTTLLLANSTKLLFQRFNYVEHLTINFFICGLSILASALFFVTTGIPLIFNPLLYVMIFLMTFRIFKTDKNKSEILILTFSGFFVFFIQFVIIVVTIGYIVS